MSSPSSTAAPPRRVRVYDDEDEREQQLAVDDRHKKASWRNNIFVPLGTWQQRAHALCARAKPIQS